VKTISVYKYGTVHLNALSHTGMWHLHGLSPVWASTCLRRAVKYI